MRAVTALRLLALAALVLACGAAPAPVRIHPPHNASGCPALRTEHVHHFEHACLHGGAEPPHSGARQQRRCASAHVSLLARHALLPTAPGLPRRACCTMRRS